MYYKNLLREEFNISEETLKQNINYKNLYDLLYSLERSQTLPKEVIFQILLNIEPRYLSQICNLNRNIQKVCNSELFKELHRKKYYRFGIISKEENYRIRDYIRDREISYKDRADILEWIFEFCQISNFDEFIYYFAIKLFDIFLSYYHQRISRKEIKSLAVVCIDKTLTILRKTNLPFKEYKNMSRSISKSVFDKLSIEMDKIVEKKNIKNMPTVMDYFSALINNMKTQFPEKDKLIFDFKQLCLYILFVKSLDYKFILYLPSEIVLSVAKESLEKMSVSPPGIPLSFKDTEIRELEDYLEKYIKGYNKKIVESIPYSADFYVNTDQIYNIYVIDKQTL